LSGQSCNAAIIRSAWYLSHLPSVLHRVNRAFSELAGIEERALGYRLTASGRSLLKAQASPDSVALYRSLRRRGAIATAPL
jgi:hypothetical protein